MKSSLRIIGPVKTQVSLVFLVICLFFSQSSVAFNDHSFYLGIGYFLENNVGKITQNSSGKTGFLGTPSYPLLLKYDWKFWSDYFVSPSLHYTLLDRKSAGESAKVTNWHLMIPVGSQFSGTNWDWYLGLGILNRSIEGGGGQVELSNGSGVATFSMPGGKVSSKNYTVNFGSSYNLEHSRFAFDLITEGTFTKKRTYNFLISYSYRFSGGFL